MPRLQYTPEDVKDDVEPYKTLLGIVGAAQMVSLLGLLGGHKPTPEDLKKTDNVLVAELMNNLTEKGFSIVRNEVPDAFKEALS